MSDELPTPITITVECGTEDCAETGAPIAIETFPNATIICGTCGQLITVAVAT